MLCSLFCSFLECVSDVEDIDVDVSLDGPQGSASLPLSVPRLPSTKRPTTAPNLTIPRKSQKWWNKPSEVAKTTAHRGGKPNPIAKKVKKTEPPRKRPREEVEPRSDEENLDSSEEESGE